MPKIFGVSKNPQSDSETYSEEHDHKDHEVHETLEVDMHDAHEHELDVGQIAVDVLDLAEEIIIVAPVA